MLVLSNPTPLSEIGSNDSSHYREKCDHQNNAIIEKHNTMSQRGNTRGWGGGAYIFLFLLKNTENVMKQIEANLDGKFVLVVEAALSCSELDCFYESLSLSSKS